MRITPPIAGTLQALAVGLYIALFVFILPALQNAFMAGPQVGMAFFLLLFSLSALVCGACALGYPAYQAVHGKWREALVTVATMAASLAVLIALGALFIR